MPTSRVKTSLFLTFKIAAKCQNVLHITILQADSLNQPIKHIAVVTVVKFTQQLRITQVTRPGLAQWYHGRLRGNDPGSVPRPGNQRWFWGSLCTSNKSAGNNRSTLVLKPMGMSHAKSETDGYQWPHKMYLGPTKNHTGQYLLP